MLVCLVIFALVCLTSGEAQSASKDNSYFISSILYSDYDRQCPNGLAVTDFAFKLINSSSSNGNESSQSGRKDGSNGRSRQDVSLKGHCSRHIDKNALTTDLAEYKINDSSIQCRHGATFSIQGSVTETDYEIMCKPGEYIGGALSNFWNNNRLLKLKCCQASGVLIHDSSFGCYNVNADKDNIRSLVRYGKNCPVDVLTGVRFTNGTNLIGRYCSLSIIGIDYTNTTCKEDRFRDLLNHPVSKATTFMTSISTMVCILIFAHNIYRI